MCPKFWPLNVSLADRHLSHRLAAKYGTGGRLGWQSAILHETSITAEKDMENIVKDIYDTLLNTDKF